MPTNRHPHSVVDLSAARVIQLENIAHLTLQNPLNDKEQRLNTELLAGIPDRSRRKRRVRWIMLNQSSLKKHRCVDESWIYSVKRSWNGKRANNPFRELRLASKATNEK
jgi:hypothetical protein